MLSRFLLVIILSFPVLGYFFHGTKLGQFFGMMAGFSVIFFVLAACSNGRPYDGHRLSPSVCSYRPSPLRKAAFVIDER